MRAEITTRAATGGIIRLDGTDISYGCRGFTLSAAVGDLPRLELDVTLVDISTVEADHVQVHIPPAARDLLIQLGWTPPPADWAPPADPTHRKD